MRAVSLGATLPRAMRGQNEAVAIANLNDFQIRDTRGAGTFESMYENTLDQVLNGAGRETFEAVKLMQSIQKQPYTPAGGVQYPNSALGQNLMQIARLIKSNVGLEVAFAEMGGWDTHVNEVGARPTQWDSSPICWGSSEARWQRFTRTWATRWPTSASSP